MIETGSLLMRNSERTRRGDDLLPANSDSDYSGRR